MFTDLIQTCDSINLQWTEYEECVIPFIILFIINYSIINFKLLFMKKQLAFLLFLLFLGLPILAQNMSISGIVLDKKLNEPIIGASVLLQGTSNGSITDLEGKFALENIAVGSKLVVSYIGFRTQEILVTSGKTDYKILLEEDTQTLDEVVVVGFGTQKKVNLTGAVASVDNKVLESRPVTSVGQALQGVVPGLNVSVPNAGGRYRLKCFPSCSY